MSAPSSVICYDQIAEWPICLHGFCLFIIYYKYLIYIFITPYCLSHCRYTRITDQSALVDLHYEGASAKFHFPPNYLYNVPAGLSLRFVYKVRGGSHACMFTRYGTRHVAHRYVSLISIIMRHTSMSVVPHINVCCTTHQCRFCTTHQYRLYCTSMSVVPCYLQSTVLAAYAASTAR